jgi:hypothetical protein
LIRQLTDHFAALTVVLLLVSCLPAFLLQTPRVNMHAIEVTIQNLIGSGMDPKTENNPYLGFVYTSFQERATKVSRRKAPYRQRAATAALQLRAHAGNRTTSTAPLDGFHSSCMLAGTLVQHGNRIVVFASCCLFCVVLHGTLLVI